MDYTFQVSSLSVASQFNPVDIRQGTLFASDLLSLSIALGDVTLRLNRAILPAPLIVAVELPAVAYRRGAVSWTVAPLEPRLRLSRASLTYASYYEIPQVFPATREFDPPAYPVTQARTQSGTVKQRIWASRPGGGSLKLGFVNISDADAEGLAKTWDRTKGRRLGVTLPSRLFRGVDPALQAHLELNGQPLTWVFSRQPMPRSVFPGVSSIDLEFAARGYGGQALPIVTTPDPPREWLLPSLAIPLSLNTVSLNRKRVEAIQTIAMALTVPAVNLRLSVNRAFVQPLALAIGTPNATFRRGTTSLLLPMTGSNGSTTFTDTSGNAFTATRFGNAQISTAQSKWGSGSGLFDGNGDYLTIAYAAALDLLNSNCTVEGWIRLAGGPSASGMRIAAAGGGAAAWNSTNGIHWLLQVAANSAINLQLRIGTGAYTLLTSGTCSLNTWHHVAFCIQGSTGYVALDGTVNSSTITGLSRPSTNPVTTVGTINGEAGSSTTAFNGNINDLRIIKGTALYTASFTPPGGSLSAQL